MEVILSDFEPKPSTSKGFLQSHNEDNSLLKSFGKKYAKKGCKDSPAWKNSTDSEDEGKILFNKYVS